MGRRVAVGGAEGRALLVQGGDRFSEEVVAPHRLEEGGGERARRLLAALSKQVACPRTARETRLLSARAYGRRGADQRGDTALGEVCIPAKNS